MLMHADDDEDEEDEDDDDDRISLCDPVTKTCSVDQAALKFRDPPASASQVLVLKARTTTSSFQDEL